MKRSYTQRVRQESEYRSNGRYAKVNPCYACGKSSGVEYFSHPLTDTKNWHDAALCLCRKCAKATDHMTDVNEFYEFCKKFYLREVK
jgi:hypothetical protein